MPPRRSAAKPWSKSRAARRELSPDQQWAAEITRRILHDCHPWQRDAVIDPSRRVSFCVGRGGAKTTTKRARALIKLIWLRKQRVGYAATSAEHARELNWDKLKDVCENYGIKTTGSDPDVSFLDTKMIMTCRRTGSVYRLRGVEDKRDAEKFRGFPQAEFQIDEAGSFSPQLLEYVLTTCVAPRLGEALALPPGLLEYLAGDGDIEDAPELGEDRGGCLVVGSTPPAVLAGEFYEITRDGSKRHRPYAQRDRPEYEGWRGYSSHFWTLLDVVSLPNASDYPALQALWQEALVEKAEKGWSDDNPTWLREYEGKWSADNTETVFKYRPHVDGKPWNEWNPHGEKPLDGVAGLKAALAELPKEVGVFHHAIAMDMGSRDPFACNVFSFAPRDPQRRIFHTLAFERTGMYAKTIAEMLIGPELDASKPTGIIGAIGWPDGMVIDADQATIDELSKVYGIRLAKAERKQDYKYGAVELVNGDLVDGRILILRGSPLAQQIVVLQWKPDDWGNPRENKAQANHSTDTLIYGRKLIALLFESGVVEQEGETSKPAYVDPMGLGPGIDTEPQRDEFEGLFVDPTYGDSGWG